MKIGTKKMIQMTRCKVINTQSVNNKKQYLFFLKKSVKEKKEKLKNNKKYR